jgi:predicted DCC family thiol-disulfide oxidoreductase YuxK
MMLEKDVSDGYTARQAPSCLIDAEQLGFASELENLRGIIFFDGRCRFCCRVVNALLAVDAERTLRVCSIHSMRGRTLIAAVGRRPDDTFAFLTAAAIFFDVEAYVAILSLDKRTRPLAHLIYWTPSVVSSALYRWIARHRSTLSAVVPRSSTPRIAPERFVAGGIEN